MATFETASLGLAVMEWVRNLRRDIRSNAAFYLAEIARGRPVGQLAALVAQHAGEYLALIGGLDLYISDATRRAKLLDGLAVFSINQATASAQLSALRTAAEGQRDAPRTSYAEITTLANSILSGLAAYDLPQRI